MGTLLYTCAGYLQRTMADALGHKALLLAWYADNIIPSAQESRLVDYFTIRTSKIQLCT